MTSPQVKWHHGTVTRYRRQQLILQKSVLIWFTGLSGAGKTTLAHAVEEELHLQQRLTFVLDGDNVRQGLCRDLGFTEQDRTENIRRAGEVARLFLDAGVITLAAFISPNALDRDRCRSMFAPDEFLEIYCRCSIEVCEQRDVKGLYQRARVGQVTQFTGISSKYEIPASPDLVVDTGAQDLGASTALVLDLLRRRGLIEMEGHHRPPQLSVGRTEVIVLGDSHAEVFRHAEMQQRFPDYFFNVVSVPGATVSGLENPNSATQAWPIFEASLAKTSASTVVVMLGEVDLGFVLWFRAEKLGLAVQELAQQLLLRFQAMLAALAHRFRVVWVSAPLPTIADGHEWGDVANKRKEVRATQRQRTRLTLEFNAAMQLYCEAQNIQTVMLDSEALGADGCVRVELLNDNPLDHHYHAVRHVAMMWEKLHAALASTQQVS